MNRGTKGRFSQGGFPHFWTYLLSRYLLVHLLTHTGAQLLIFRTRTASWLASWWSPSLRLRTVSGCRRPSPSSPGTPPSPRTASTESGMTEREIGFLNEPSQRTTYRVTHQDGKNFLLALFRQFLQLGVRHCSYLLPRQDGGTSQM